MRLMQQIMNIYDDAQQAITGAEKLLYQKSVAKKQGIHTLMNGSLKDVLRAKQKLKDLDRIIGEQKGAQRELEVKHATLMEAKSAAGSADPDLNHASYVMKALHSEEPIKTAKKKSKKSGIRWGDEKEGGQLTAETVFVKDEPPIAVTRPSSSHDGDTKSSQASPSANKGTRP